MSTAVMWSKSKPDVEFQYDGRLDEFNGMSSQSHLPYCRVQSPGEINVMIVPHCRYKNSVRHIENRFSPYFIFFWFLMQFRLWRAAAFVSSPIHLLSARFYGMDTCRYLTVLFCCWRGCIVVKRLHGCMVHVAACYSGCPRPVPRGTRWVRGHCLPPP